MPQELIDDLLDKTNQAFEESLVLHQRDFGQEALHTMLRNCCNVVIGLFALQATANPLLGIVFSMGYAAGKCAAMLEAGKGEDA